MRLQLRNLCWLGAAVLAVACSNTSDAPPSETPSCAEGSNCPDAGPGPSPCPGGGEICAGACVDTKSSKESCGACGAACPDLEVCRQGVCVCPADGVRCEGGCVDPRTDKKHCGATAGCGNGSGNAGAACSAGSYCVNAACRNCRTWGSTPLTHPLPGISSTETFEEYVKSLKSVEAADLDGDGKLDLAVGSRNTVITLRGRGDGKFDTLQIAGTPYYYGAMPSTRLADMDGDGKRDAIVSGGIYYGYGDGTLDPAFKPLPATPYPPALFDIGDIDGDGKLDIAALPSYQDPSNAQIQILLNQGNRQFAPAPAAVMDRTSESIALRDVDGDGKLDLVLANANKNPYPTFEGAKYNAVSVLLGSGDGTFQPQTSYPATGNFPVWADVGDVDGDGRADILSANCEGYGCGTSDSLKYAYNFSLFAGKGDGSFGAPKSIFGGSSIRRVLVRDLNDDGIVDLVFSELEAPRISVRLGQGGGTFLPIESFDLFEPYPVLAGDDQNISGTGFDVADVDADGMKDLIVVHTDAVSVFLGAKRPECP